jgi:hypothetical protein
MPERSQDFGKYGARGIKGHEAVARQLDTLAGYVAMPPTTRRGLLARLHYLTRTDHARQAARNAGLTVADRTPNAWLKGKRSSSKKDLERIETAYRTVRRHNAARYLFGRLNAAGRGARVEVHPLNQSQAARPRQRIVEYRSFNVRNWDRMV